MKIVSDNGFEKDVPLHAYMPQASLIFEPFINFGFTKVAKPASEYVYFYNEGKTATRVNQKYLSIKYYLKY